MTSTSSYRAAAAGLSAQPVTPPWEDFRCHGGRASPAVHLEPVDEIDYVVEPPADAGPDAKLMAMARLVPQIPIAHVAALATAKKAGKRIAAQLGLRSDAPQHEAECAERRTL
jgi:hypothetical protein